MRVISSLILLPALASAFAPTSPAFTSKVSTTRVYNEFTDLCDTTTTKVEDAVGQVDSLALKRVMRFADHAPVLFTLSALGTKLASTKFGIDAAPAALQAASIATSIPTYFYYVWPVISICQLASVAKSSLNADANELSQGDITALTVANIVATRAMSAANPLRWAIALPIISGFSSRSSGGGEMTIHNAALQLMSSFTTIAAILAAASALPSVMPFLAGKTEITSAIGLFAYYINTMRAGNTKIKTVLNAAIVTGMLWTKIASGGLSMTTSSILSLSTATLVGTGYIAYEALMKAKTALA